MILDRSLYDIFRRHVLAHVYHVKIIILQKDFYDVLADIVDIASYSRDNHCSFWLALFPALFERRPYHFKCSLCGFRAHQQLRQKHLLLFKSFSNDIERRNQFFIDHIY